MEDIEQYLSSAGQYSKIGTEADTLKIEANSINDSIKILNLITK